MKVHISHLPAIIPMYVILPLILLLPIDLFARNEESPSENSVAANNTHPGIPGLYDHPVSAADLRLISVIPGPRHVSSRDVGNNGRDSDLMSTISGSPGYAFLASALVPGLGQAANRQWWKTALFVTIEATAIGFYIHRENRGRDGERYYQAFGNEHWSVVKYARYIADVHEPNQHNYEFRDMLNSNGQSMYDEQNGNLDPVFDIDIEWEIIDIDALRDAERNSLHDNGNPFSHYLPDFGSQQYYELMSKYHQFGPGWHNWNNNTHDIDSGTIPDDFLYHAQVGYDFNTDLSTARNMLAILLTNHFVAAFDAYFTQQLRSARLQSAATMERGLHPTLVFQYRF